MSWSGVVYQCLDCDHHYLPEYGPIRCPKCDSKEREITGMIENPAEFIALVINSGYQEVESLVETVRGLHHCDCCHKVASTMTCDLDGTNRHHYCSDHW